MKYVKFAVLFLATAFAGFAFADPVYPWTNPTYIPNAVDGAITVSAPYDNPMPINGIGTVTLRVSGTCTSLAAVMQATNDGTNFTAINLYPIATVTTAPVAVASISAAGFWKINTVGYTGIKLHVTALTASCTVAMVGHPGSFNGTNF